MKITYLISLITSIICMFVGAMFKIMHWPYGRNILLTGLLIELLFIIIGIVTVMKNKTLPIQRKVIWVVGFIVLRWITGLIYYPVLKKLNK